VVQESNGDPPQDDASLTPGGGIGGEAEGEREPKTDVQLGVGTEHTAQHNHTHTQEGGYREADRNVHHEVATKLTTVLSNLIQGGSEGTALTVGKSSYLFFKILDIVKEVTIHNSSGTI
jgi:hypothetical protein